MVTLLSRLPVSTCPLGEGGSPKGRGWIRLEEAGSAKQLTSFSGSWKLKAFTRLLGARSYIPATKRLISSRLKAQSSKLKAPPVRMAPGHSFHPYVFPKGAIFGTYL
jgi:hypothetical protein